MSDFVDLIPLNTSVAPAARRPLFGDDAILMRAVIGVGVLVALWKLVIALSGNVIWEEAHFVVLGQHPDLAYPDVPAGWPLFARLCTSIFGWSAAAIRIPGLIVAEAIPLAIYWLAKGVVSHREALWAALIAIVAPAFSASGVIFYPEEALQIALAVMLGAILRATRPEAEAAPLSRATLALWALAGAAGAVGLFVHFRFVLAGLGVAIYLVAAPSGRRQWRRPGLWLAAAIALIGLLPGLIYNMREHWPALAYQVANRPSYRFHPAWLLTFIENQLGLATPAFLIAFGASASLAWRRARSADGPAALLLSVAAPIFGLYALLSLFDSQVMPHWPWLAYVALVPLAPGILIHFVDGAFSAGRRRLRMALVTVLGPVIAIVGGVAGSTFELGWAHADAVPTAYKPLLFTRLEDWRLIERALERARTTALDRFGGGAPVIAAAGHVAALRLEFPADPARRVFALDEPYDEFTRFSVIRRAWGLDEAGLKRDHDGGSAVLVLPEPSYLYNTPAELAFRRRLCREFNDIRPSEIAELPPGRVAVELYTARVAAPNAGAACPLLPRLYMAQPVRAAQFRAHRFAGGLFGLASDPMGVVAVRVLLDGRPVADAKTGLNPDTAPPVPEFKDDPGYPALWFSYALPADALTVGEHRLSIRAVLRTGQTKDSAARTIYVN